MRRLTPDLSPRDSAERSWVTSADSEILMAAGILTAPPDQIKGSYALHLEKLRDWLREQKNIEVLYVSYNDLVDKSEEQAERVSAFLGSKANVAGMVKAVDPSLYRNRRTTKDEPA